MDESVNLLCQLGESPSELASQFILISQARLNKDLDELTSFKVQSELESTGDVISIFIEKCCNTALNHIALTVATYNNFFPSESSRNQ